MQRCISQERGARTWIFTRRFVHDNIEFRNLEFDHLTEDEQRNMFGISYGLKKQGVAELFSYDSQKREARKCLLVCLLCHKLNTKERRDAKYGADKVPAYHHKVIFVEQESASYAMTWLTRKTIGTSNLTTLINHQRSILFLTLHAAILFVIQLTYYNMKSQSADYYAHFCHRVHSGRQTTERYSTKRQKAN